MHIASIGIDWARPRFTWLPWENAIRFWCVRSSLVRNCWPIRRTCRPRSWVSRLAQEPTLWEPHCENKVTRCD